MTLGMRPGGLCSPNPVPGWFHPLLGQGQPQIQAALLSANILNTELAAACRGFLPENPNSFWSPLLSPLDRENWKKQISESKRKPCLQHTYLFMIYILKCKGSKLHSLEMNWKRTESRKKSQDSLIILGC